MSASQTKLLFPHPLLDPVESDLDLTKEELEELEAATRAKDKAYASSYGREKRASPTEGWKASQKARNAKQYPQTRAKQVKAIEEKTFYCSVCDVACADASAQAMHNGTPTYMVASSGRKEHSPQHDFFFPSSMPASHRKEETPFLKKGVH